MQAFRDTLDLCGLVDLDYTGPNFTWHGRRGGEMVWERLDRSVVNYEWIAKFPIGQVHHLNSFTFDHCPILVSLMSKGERQRWRRKPFRFEAMWLTEPSCNVVVSRAWECRQDGTPMYVATKKLKRCKKLLKAWSRDHFGNVVQKIKRTKELLWKAEEEATRSGNSDEMERLKSELRCLYDKEEKMWQQRSRLQRLQNRDQNTRFFHGTATQRKRRNFIKGLRDENGVWQKDETVFSGILNRFYKELFTSSNPLGLDRILDGVHEVVTEEMRVDLAKPYTAEEVDCAIKEMAPLKALGPDGMPLLFYQTYWIDVGMDVSQLVLSSLNSGSLLKSVNHTFITLIPKVKNPERVTKFRPISLCNVIYKIVSKVIGNRLKPILNSIISETQSAFVANRLITNNFFFCF